MNKNELKELIRTEPTIRSTFDAVGAQLVQIKASCETPVSLLRDLQAVQARHDELQASLDAIEDAKKQLAALVAEESAPTPAPSEVTATEGEPAGDTPADDPEAASEGETS